MPFVRNAEPPYLSDAEFLDIAGQQLRQIREDQQVPELPTITSKELMRGGRVLIILHGTDKYRLRITNAGKLILTK